LVLVAFLNDFFRPFGWCCNVEETTNGLPQVDLQNILFVPKHKSSDDLRLPQDLTSQLVYLHGKRKGVDRGDPLVLSSGNFAVNWL
jgi:hypothetical protein